MSLWAVLALELICAPAVPQNLEPTNTSTVETSTDTPELDEALLDLGELLDVDVAELVPIDGGADDASNLSTHFLATSSRFPAQNPAAPIWPVASSTGAPTFDIPLSNDPRVETWISHLSGRGRWTMERWLSRLTRFAPIYFEVLDRHGVPRDLIFLSMIESGFVPLAYSWAHAVGPWQFIAPTARRYGLHVDFWVDERRDFELATDAAARYLKDLYAMFGNWHLAWAGYNAGEWKVQKAIRRTGSGDFWRISRTRQLRRETQHYVPKLIAAAIVSKNALAHGFDRVPYEAPLEWDEVEVEDSVRLSDLAKTCALTEDQLRTLNPALYRGYTPPEKWFVVRVPRGSGPLCSSALSLVPKANRVVYRGHEIKRGETIETIAAVYKTTPEAILTLNKIEPSQLGLFDALLIPVPWSVRAEVPDGSPTKDWNTSPPFAPGGQEAIVHRVRPGESLWRIAKKYRASVRDVRRWNGLYGNVRLKAGQKIRILLGTQRGTR